PGSRGLLRSEDEVALPCIRKLVAASSFSKPKVLTAASTLKFIPEELAVFCRDFRLLRFSFPENGLAPQAFRVANAIAEAREAAAWLGDAAEGRDGWSCPGEAPPEEEDEDEDEEEGSPTTLLFESLRDWEEELQRLGAAGWRVSAVNERFDMAPSLPQYLWVPSGLLDHDLKRAFGHFQERRVPRLCWHHPGGGDLLRAAGFHPASEPGSEDVRWGWGFLCPSPVEKAGKGEGWKGNGLERWSPLLTTSPSPEPSDRDLNCLVASLVQLLGDPHARSLPGFQSLVQREWVAAGHPFPHRLGLLCRDAPREEAPVFLLFLDCTWQLLRQFPADFGFTEAFLLALHDSSFSPYFSTFRFSCQRQRGRSSVVRGRGHVAAPPNPPISPLLLLTPPQFLHPRSTPGMGTPRSPISPLLFPALPAGFPSILPNPCFFPFSQPGDPCLCWGPGLVLTLAKGSLYPHSLPWWSRPPLRPPHRVSPPESPGMQGGLVGGSEPTPGLLLPCTAGPCVLLWHRCYLRGLPQEQRGRLAPSLAGLAEELELLQDRLHSWNTQRPH
ncbi:MTMRB protein, partial [Dasyornis broadbenti]|nr:MTMRB protein [Dasyornis broadbenti]